VVVYRRPVESRAESQRELSLIVQDIVVEQVAGLFGMAPEDLDPRYED
jgi:predicted Zn-dependent protease with MMP-like domain